MQGRRPAPAVTAESAIAEACMREPEPMNETLRHAETDAEIAACFPVMRLLRPHLTGLAEELRNRVRRQADAGYRILAAWRGDEAVGLAGYRPQENLVRGPFCYVDDLVVRDDLRRSGLGATLLKAVGTEAAAPRVAPSRPGHRSRQFPRPTVLFSLWHVAGGVAVRHAAGVGNDHHSALALQPVAARQPTVALWPRK